jgi:predicted DNA binding CopG/RHH family protein
MDNQTIMKKTDYSSLIAPKKGLSEPKPEAKKLKKDERILIAYRLSRPRWEALKILIVKERISAQKYIESLIEADFAKRGLQW